MALVKAVLIILNRVVQHDDYVHVEKSLEEENKEAFRIKDNRILRDYLACYEEQEITCENSER